MRRLEIRELSSASGGCELALSLLLSGMPEIIPGWLSGRLDRKLEVGWGGNLVFDSGEEGYWSFGAEGAVGGALGALGAVGGGGRGERRGERAGIRLLFCGGDIYMELRS